MTTRVLQLKMEAPTRGKTMYRTAEAVTTPSVPISQFGNYPLILLKLFQIYQTYARFQIEVLLFGREVRACAQRFGQAHKHVSIVQ